eukprot:7766041-Pyramimonas_sp.AAC.1
MVGTGGGTGTLTGKGVLLWRWSRHWPHVERTRIVHYRWPCLAPAPRSAAFSSASLASWPSLAQVERFQAPYQ